jgi:thiol-disulfide isomerase/thioredoxin
MLRSLLTLLALCAGSLALAADTPTPGSVPLATLDGQPATLSAHAGKTATVVAFVSFECPVSNSYAAQLDELAKTNAEKGVAVVLVCPTDEKPEAVKKLSAGFKLSIPVLLDPKKQLAAALKAEITPEVFVLDAENKTLYRGRIDDAYSARLKKNPTVTSHDLADALATALAGKPVKVARTKAVGCPIDFDTKPGTGTVTYSKHVAPILNRHCVVCHRAGEVGPFSLTSYNAARRWADDIKEYTASRAMPPWMPAHGVAMRGERKMTAEEIATLAAWADGGAPEGDPKDAPKPPEFGDGWRHGKPDLILGPDEPFQLSGSGNDLFRVFVVPTGLTEDRWVIGYDVKPGNPRVVHHTLHFFDTTGQGRELEKKQKEKDKGRRLLDVGPGYTVGMGVGFVPPGRDSGEAPKFGGIGGWAPGQGPQFVPKGAGWLLPKGSDFLIQAHYHRNGQFATDRTRVGLYFARGPVEKPWQTLIVNGFRPWEKIPAGKADYAARGGVYLHTDAVLHNVLPHMHLRGKSVRVTMTPPDGGKPVVLVDIPAWDYRWQETYWFKEPITAKAGTRLEVSAVFDNSAENPNNPTRPPREVSYGEETTDEMLYVFFGATSTATPSKRIRTYGFPPTNVGPPVPGQMTPVLEGLVGTWDATTELKVAGRGITLKGKDVSELAFGGTYVRGLATNAADERGAIILITFDPAAKKYRMWMYDSLGTEVAWVGTHDEQAKEIRWTSDVSDGVKGAMTWKLADVGYTWEVTITSGGKTLMEMKGDHTKKK